jgi:hypothetical protein
MLAATPVRPAAAGAALIPNGMTSTAISRINLTKIGRIDKH